jgi:hypothetical protein
MKYTIVTEDMHTKTIKHIYTFCFSIFHDLSAYKKVNALLVVFLAVSMYAKF